MTLSDLQNHHMSLLF